MLKKIAQKLFSEIPYFPQIWALITFAKGKYRNSGFSLFINLDSVKRKITIRKKKNGEEVNFIFCKSGEIRKALGESRELEENWGTIFKSDDFEIWENKSVHNILPLRFDLSDEEKTYALKIIRESANNFFSGGKESNDTLIGKNQRLKEKYDVCVAIWIEGRVRGSVILRESPLEEALLQGGQKVLRDSRFKPVAESELKKARIEITLMSDLYLPVGKNSIKEKSIDPNLAYFVKSRNKTGWYMPEMFNCFNFQSLESLREKLSSSKAKMNANEFKESSFYYLPVEDFIESEDKKNFYKMDGPVPILKRDADILEVGNLAVEQLANIQEADGNIPLSINPLNGEIRKFGLGQMACTIWALSEFGKASDNKKALRVAEKGFSYSLPFILENPSRIGAVNYLGKASYALGKKDASDKLLEIARQANNLSYEPILFANTGSFLGEHAKNEADLKKAERFAEIVWQDYMEKINLKRPLSFARYPELINAFIILEKKTKDSKYKERIERLSKWYREKQLPNGAFPNFSERIYPSPYTRGTGKIFETFSLLYNDNKELVDKAFSWLVHMQYRDESLYFVKPELRDKIKGGLRHDYLNQEVWIDGSAHLLIGISRLILDQKNLSRLKINKHE